MDDPDSEVSGSSDDDSPDALDELRKHSEHGLGHLLSPAADGSRDWIAELWDYIIRTDGHGQSFPALSWLGLPAVTRSAVTTWELQKRFDRYNRAAA